jgi:hypothetical protein
LPHPKINLHNSCAVVKDLQILIKNPPRIPPAPSCAAERPCPKTKRSRAEKLPHHFLILRASIFFFLKVRQFFCEAVLCERRGGGLPQVRNF